MRVTLGISTNISHRSLNLNRVEPMGCLWIPFSVLKISNTRSFHLINKKNGSIYRLKEANIHI